MYPHGPSFLIRPFRLLACKIARNFRKMRHRGYGPKIENYDIAPRDPEIEEKRKQVMQAMTAMARTNRRSCIPSHHCCPV